MKILMQDVNIYVNIWISNKYLNEKINEGKITLRYVETNNMVADSLTKNISVPKMKNFTDFIFE